MWPRQRAQPGSGSFQAEPGALWPRLSLAHPPGPQRPPQPPPGPMPGKGRVPRPTRQGQAVRTGPGPSTAPARGSGDVIGCLPLSGRPLTPAPAVPERVPVSTGLARTSPHPFPRGCAPCRREAVLLPSRPGDGEPRRTNPGHVPRWAWAQCPRQSRAAPVAAVQGPRAERAGGESARPLALHRGVSDTTPPYSPPGLSPSPRVGRWQGPGRCRSLIVQRGSSLLGASG